MDPEPSDILDFWFGLEKEQHFKPDTNLDREITDRFGKAHARARDGKLDGWLNTPEGAMALIILLDQFSRNMFRGTPDMFAADEQALELTKAAIANGHDVAMPVDKRIWFYLPLQHSEDQEDQDMSVKLTQKMDDPETLKYAQIHRDVIEQFGRFPHRNEILGRQSTPEERTFLAQGGFSA